MRVGSLFSGIGGFELGLERAGMTVVWQSEIDPYASQILKKHWPEVPNHGDIRNVRAGAVEPVDVICGGFPCQDISNAGKRAGIDGERSGLWSEYARVIGELRPRYVFMENVAALLARGFERVIGDLAALGYDAEWHCIPASSVGAPHRRDRVWIVAYPYSPRLEGRLREILRECTEQRAAWESGASDAGRPVHDAVRVGHLCEDGEIRAGRNAAEYAGWWSSEPDVGRVAHGVPAELDRGGHAEEEHHAQSGTQGDGGHHRVPDVRSDGPATAASPRLLAADIGRGLVSVLPRHSGPAGRNAGNEGDAEVCVLRERLPADAQQEAQAVQREMPVTRWPHERGEAVGEVWRVEPDVGRVAVGIANRVDRLRCLGNAIVPQVAEVIGRAVMNG